jgi:hypothetical protein
MHKVIEAFRLLSPSAEALLTLPLDACRWPMDDPRWWCGKPATCGSYCTEHHRDSRVLEIKRLSPSKGALNAGLDEITRPAGPRRSER